MHNIEKQDSFKFALTSLTAVGTIIYTSYYYFQTSTLHESLFVHVMAYITTLFIFSIFLITYVLIKGFSTDEIQIKLPKYFNKCPQYVSFNKLANILYLSAFSVWVILLIPLTIVVLAIPIGIPCPFYISLLIVIVFIWLVGYTFDKCECLIISLFLILVGIGFFISYIPISVLFQGHVEINMDNKYYKDSTPMIPVSIEITGRRTESTIYLYNKSSEIDNITLETNRNGTLKSGGNRTLFGNVFSFGRYNIFINITNPNMTEGYYELVYKRPIMNGYYAYSNKYLNEGFEYGKSFYLVNNGSK